MKHETERLILSELDEAEHAPFMLELLTDPAFIRNIGDRGVRDVAGAAEYVRTRAIASYAANGFGLYAVELKSTGEATGVCGLVRRDGLDEPDIGFAFLPRYLRQGYATESARAVIDHARDTLGLPRIAGITSPDNQASIRVLEKLGLTFRRMIQIGPPPEGPRPTSYYLVEF